MLFYPTKRLCLRPLKPATCAKQVRLDAVPMRNWCEAIYVWSSLSPASLAVVAWTCLT